MTLDGSFAISKELGGDYRHELYKWGKRSDRTPFGLRPKMPKVTFFKKSLYSAKANSTLNHFQQ